MTLSGPITEHFNWEEARCRDGCEMPLDVQESVRITAEWAERVRDLLGGRPMRILSWYRCPEYNRRVGGASQSQHLFGKAIDFAHKDLLPHQTRSRIIDRDTGLLVRGLGHYPGFTHIDRRASDVRVEWGGE